MPLLYYVQASSIGLAITLIIAFHMFFHNVHRTASRNIFWGLLVSNMLLHIMEMLLNIFTGESSPLARVLLPPVVCVFYILNPVPEALWVLYLDSILRKQEQKKQSRLLLSLVFIPLALNLIFSLLSLFGGFLFTIDSQNIYRRGPYFSIMLLLCYSYLMYNIVIILVKRKRILMHEFLVALFAALLPVLAGIIQGTFFGISIMWTALSFSLLIAYMNLQSDQVYRELRALDKLKDEFLANTSHELKTPLNGIINVTGSMLESGHENLNAIQKQNLRVVASSARRLYGLINDILDISSLKRGEIQIKKQAADLHSIAGATLYVFSRLKDGKTIEFINGIPEGLPPVEADVERLYQIFYNLLGNALKFTEQGRITVGAASLEEYAEIWVEDTGCGISPDRQADIFKAFYIADASATRGTDGSGLGLSITQNLVALHGGKIRVSSRPGQGSRFTFTLPFSRSDKGSAYVEKSVAASVQTSALKTAIPIPGFITTDRERGDKRHAILIADDDPASLMALFNILDREGYYVRAVTSGEAALKEIEDGKEYDLLILDVMMPRMSGYQVLEKIRRRFQPVDLPVLLLTAKARPEDLQAGLEGGANDYLTKPFESQELKARVRTLVQLKALFKARLETELSFLQAQIKPHFLFNSLSVITALSTEEPKRAEELLYDLSDYLRGSFNFENYNGVTPLDSELTTVRAYVSIEKERFKSRLEVAFDVDEDINIYVPMLILQPLVENAIRHGVSKKSAGGKVKVSVKRNEGGTLIAVEDDGVGIEARKLARILSGRDKNSGVGLNNIQRRMLLYYGHGMEISSTEGQGTTVVMKIPNHGGSLHAADNTGG